MPQAFSHVGIINTALNLTPKQPAPAHERHQGSRKDGTVEASALAVFSAQRFPITGILTARSLKRRDEVC